MASSKILSVFKYVMLIFIITVMIVAVVMFFMNPETHTETTPSGLTMILFWLFYFGSYPAFAGLVAWQSESSGAACITLLIGALAMGYFGAAFCSLTLDNWLNPLVVVTSFGMSGMQWGIVGVTWALLYLISSINSRKSEVGMK